MKVAIIGAGASGLMAAVSAAQSADVTVYEKNQKTGKKLFITGKGRCNLTNLCSPSECIDNIVNGKKFLYSAIYSFPPQKTVDFFENLGVKLKVERGRRVFPVSDKSSDIVAALTRAAARSGVKFVFSEVYCIDKTAGGFEVKTCDERCEYDKIILACGGMSYPATGSTGDGYKFAQKFGHEIVRPRPALVPLILKDDVACLQGLSLKNVSASVTTGKTGKKYTQFGEMLFTGSGVSGPIILTLSSFINKYDLDGAKLSVDLKPALDPEVLDKRLVHDFQKYQNKCFKNSLNDLLPKKLIDFFVAKCGIDPDKKVNAVTKAERAKIVGMLKNLEFDIHACDRIEAGIITAGGVALDAINPKTMESKLTPGLYFAGEVMDVDALTGGYNLQIAFATGYVAGKHAGEDNL